MKGPPHLWIYILDVQNSEHKYELVILNTNLFTQSNRNGTKFFAKRNLNCIMLLDFLIDSTKRTDLFV